MFNYLFNYDISSDYFLCVILLSHYYGSIKETISNLTIVLTPLELEFICGCSSPLCEQMTLPLLSQLIVTDIL